jgi:SAM-dependent methyltransferase
VHLMKLFLHPLQRFNQCMTETGNCLDIGALDFTQYLRIKDLKPKIQHFGIDYMAPTVEIPLAYTFKQVDLNHSPIPFDEDMFDYIVASHIIEHLDKPLDFFAECLRVLKPGGKLYIEAPSEKSLMVTGMNFDYDGFYSLNMYDDPTHTKRPWTPNSYWRLARYFGADPLQVGYVRSKLVWLFSPILVGYCRLFKKSYLLEKVTWLAIGWASYAIISKTKPGAQKFSYTIPTKAQRLQ